MINLEVVKKINKLFGTSKLNWFLGFACIAFLLCGIYTFIYISVVEFPLSLEISSTGFTHFFELFSGPIKLLTAFIALFALFLTSRRMEQTEKQIEMISKQVELTDNNNKFNNYFIHKNNFMKDFKNLHFYNLIKVIDENSIKVGVFDERYNFFTRNQIELDSFTKYVHGFYFGARPDLFTAAINTGENSKLEKLIKNLRGIKTISVNTILSTSTMNIVPQQFKALFNKIIETEKSIFKKYRIESTLFPEKSFILYYLTVLYLCILEYQNEPVPIEILDFISKVHQIRKSLNLEILKEIHGVTV